MPTLNLGTDDGPTKRDGPRLWEAAPVTRPPQSAVVDSFSTDTVQTRTVNIGTDSAAITKAGPEPELLKTAPNLNLADVARHMMKLQSLIQNGGQPIAADSFEVMNQITDHLDQVYYWGIVESRFPDHPFSALCECEVIETLTPVLEHDRPLLVTAALKALSSVLQQPIACKHFSKRAGSFPALFTSLTKFPSKEEVVADAIAVCRSAAPGNVEEFLASDCLSGVISGMQRHTANVEIQKRGALLFADLVGMPRSDPEAVPISILFVHIGQIVDFVLLAAERQNTSSQVSDAVAHFLEVASSRPENVLKLLSNPSFLKTAEVIAAKSTSIRNPKAIISALAAIGNTFPALSLKGKMRMASVLRDIMVKSTDVAILATCFALQHSLLTLTKCPPPPLPQPAPSDDEPASQEPKLTLPKGRQVPALTPEQAYSELKAYMTEEQVPQCILIALDHFGEEGDALHQVGKMAVGEMAVRSYHWR